MAAETLWAIIAKSSRGAEWFFPDTIRGTRRATIAAYNDGSPVSFQQGRETGRLRVGKVRVEVVPPPPQG